MSTVQLQHIQNLRKIFLKSVESVKPVNLFAGNAKYDLKPRLSSGKSVVINIQGKTVDITRKRCHLVGFGKAVLGMAVQIEKALHARLVSGLLSIPIGTTKQFAHDAAMQLAANTHIQVIEGAHNNQPDTSALEAAHRIMDVARSMSENDILFVLISGGGSALLPMPKAPITLEQKMDLVRTLANKGAAIDEMNIVRIALSDIKGGRLAAAARKAFAVISFVISDIVNDPIDLIASGPTCSVQTKKFTAKDVLLKYQMWHTISAEIKALIESPQQEEQLVPGKNNSIYIVGDNRVAAATTVAEGVSCGYNPFIVSTSIQGDIQKLINLYIPFLESVRKYQTGIITDYDLQESFPFDNRIFQHFLKTIKMCERTKKPLLLIMAGEPTVQVTGPGLGGRNQELALRMAIECSENQLFHDICFLSGGTDGIDGPTPAAGAIGCRLVLEEHENENHKSLHSAREFVQRNDSYSFYQQLSGGKFHVITGHTGTNVMDLHLILIP